MHSYQTLKEKYGSRVLQTVDSPIKVFDYWELGEIFLSLGIVLIVGVLMYSWSLMFFLLFLNLGLGPMIRQKNNKGFFWHWPYKNFYVQLPGIINPKGKRKYSD